MKDLISLGNSKLSKDGIASFGIPAIKTCPNALTCKAYCYAAKGFYMMPNVKLARERNLAATKRESFVTRMSEELQRRGITCLRIHDSGDFYNRAYFMKWLAICRLNPCVRFYAYTKMVSMTRALSECIPSNLRLIYSYGGIEDSLINASRDFHSRVFRTGEQLSTAGYINGTVSDLVAASGRNNKIGLELH